MNTETRRHDEQSAYHRKTKYPSPPIEDEELSGLDEEEGGVLNDWKDDVADPDLNDESPDSSQGVK